MGVVLHDTHFTMQQRIEGSVNLKVRFSRPTRT